MTAMHINSKHFDISGSRLPMRRVSSCHTWRSMLRGPSTKCWLFFVHTPSALVSSVSSSRSECKQLFRVSVFVLGAKMSCYDVCLLHRRGRKVGASAYPKARWNHGTKPTTSIRAREAIYVLEARNRQLPFRLDSYHYRAVDQRFLFFLLVSWYC